MKFLSRLLRHKIKCLQLPFRPQVGWSETEFCLTLFLSQVVLSLSQAPPAACFQSCRVHFLQFSCAFHTRAASASVYVCLSDGLLSDDPEWSLQQLSLLHKCCWSEMSWWASVYRVPITHFVSCSGEKPDPSWRRPLVFTPFLRLSPNCGNIINSGCLIRGFQLPLASFASVM